MSDRAIINEQKYQEELIRKFKLKKLSSVPMVSLCKMIKRANNAGLLGVVGLLMEEYDKRTNKELKVPEPKKAKEPAPLLPRISGGFGF